MILFLKRRFLKIFIPLIVFLLIVAIFLVFFIYRDQRKRVISGYTEFYADLLFQRSELVRTTLSPIMSTLRFVANRHLLLDSLEMGETNILTEDLKTLAMYNKSYGQLRYINVKGKEVVRINQRDGKIVVVPDSLLQDKKERPYFRETMSMGPRQVYVSPLDLNIEHGKIEEPIQRVIRFGIPVYNSNLHLLGGIFINLYLNTFFQLLPINDFHQEGKLMFLNGKGYWLYAPPEYKTFGFMYPDRQEETFQNYFPEVWEQITKRDFGHILRGDSLFIFRNVQANYTDYGNDFVLDQNSYWDPEDNWNLVVVVDLNKISSLTNLKYNFSIITIIGGFLILLISYVISRLRYLSVLHQRELKELNLSLEEKIKKRTEELDVRNKKLMVLNNELESFAYSVSHDLRAPLRHIGGFVELLSKYNSDNKELSEKSVRYLTFIRDATDEMGRLIDDLLRLSRVGRTKLNFQYFKMDELIRKTIIEVEEANPGHNFDWRLDDLFPTVYADSGLIRQVWRNLLNNAAKYSSGKSVSRITIASTEFTDYYEFVISDNGVGFDMQYAHKLFGTFQRLHLSEEFEGNGIGLAVVQRIILKHGGTVRAEGRVNEGASFYFSLLKNPENDD